MAKKDNIIAYLRRRSIAEQQRGRSIRGGLYVVRSQEGTISVKEIIDIQKTTFLVMLLLINQAHHALSDSLHYWLMDLIILRSLLYRLSSRLSSLICI